MVQRVAEGPVLQPVVDSRMTEGHHQPPHPQGHLGGVPQFLGVGSSEPPQERRKLPDSMGFTLIRVS